MLEQKLQNLIDDVPGCIGCVVMGFDGATVAMVGTEGKLGADIVGAEFSYIVDRAHQTAASLELGSLEEMAIQVEQLTIAVRLIATGYFIAALLSPRASYDTCREQLRKLGPELGELLETS